MGEKKRILHAGKDLKPSLAQSLIVVFMIVNVSRLMRQCSEWWKQYGLICSFTIQHL